METRQVTQVKLYKLILNPMRSNTEDGKMVAISYSKDKLLDWYKNEMEEKDYEEVGDPSFECHGDSHTWRKTFKKGSVLEWFNPINLFDRDSIEGIKEYGHGIQEQWLFEGQAEEFASSNNEIIFIYE